LRSQLIANACNNFVAKVKTLNLLKAQKVAFKLFSNMKEINLPNYLMYLSEQPFV
jgi:hypothetical protein